MTGSTCRLGQISESGSRYIDISILEAIEALIPLSDIAYGMVAYRGPNAQRIDLLKFALLNQWFSHRWSRSSISPCGANVAHLWHAWLSLPEAELEVINSLVEDAALRQVLTQAVITVQSKLAEHQLYVNNGVIFRANVI